jgi:hypothetical protein
MGVMMNQSPTAGQPSPIHPGLCARCAHARQVRSDRGSVFWRCALADRDPAFPRYPRLPVVDCRGFALASGGEPQPR